MSTTSPSSAVRVVAPTNSTSMYRQACFIRKREMKPLIVSLLTLERKVAPPRLRLIPHLVVDTIFFSNADLASKTFYFRYKNAIMVDLLFNFKRAIVFHTHKKSTHSPEKTLIFLSSLFLLASPFPASPPSFLSVTRRLLRVLPHDIDDVGQRKNTTSTTKNASPTPPILTVTKKNDETSFAFAAAPRLLHGDDSLLCFTSDLRPRGHRHHLKRYKR